MFCPIKHWSRPWPHTPVPVISEATAAPRLKRDHTTAQPKSNWWHKATEQAHVWIYMFIYAQIDHPRRFFVFSGEPLTFLCQSFQRGKPQQCKELLRDSFFPLEWTMYYPIYFIHKSNGGKKQNKKKNKYKMLTVKIHWIKKLIQS